MNVSEPTYRALETRFCELWRRNQIQSTQTGKYVFSALIDSLEAERRFYHNLEHIRYCLNELDKVADLLADPVSVELAIWFHDMIIDPHAKDEEIRSAAAFEQFARDDLSAALRSTVIKLILATSRSIKSPQGDQRFMIDIDLSSLAAPWDRYYSDSLALGKENPDETEEGFNTKKAVFLDSLLSKSHIYLTESFQQRYEQKARRNIQRYLRIIRP